MREYIYDMPTVMRAADLVISRGGASTIRWISALGMPSIIVPSPYVVNNHQKDAFVLEQAGGIRLVLESETAGKGSTVRQWRSSATADLREKMHKAMLALAIPDATERIYQTVMSLLPAGTGNGTK